MVLLLLPCSHLLAQTISREEMIYLTSEWKGERFPDGRPKVPDNLIKRLGKISIEEAWGVMRGDGYHNQFEGGWKMIHENQSFVGRALTATYIPSRPDIDKQIRERGKKEGRIGSPNSWPIDMLQPGDVYVANGFGKVINGTLIGDNLGNSIFSKSKNGVVFDGSVRDLEGLEKIQGFNAFVRDWDPSFIQEMTLIGLNTPTQIGRAIVMPGDVVLAKREGVIFIPAHLAEKVAINAEFIQLRDEFGITRLKEGKYTPGQIDTQWTDEIKKDFLKWLDDNPDKLPMTRAELDKFMENRTW
ncbi:MAG: RraA family protein [Microscillaceae bacterium]|nr:RraA family protein [Microscillaceae bacterium]